MRDRLVTFDRFFICITKNGSLLGNIRLVDRSILSFNFGPLFFHRVHSSCIHSQICWVDMQSGCMGEYKHYHRYQRKWWSQIIHSSIETTIQPRIVTVDIIWCWRCYTINARIADTKKKHVFPIYIQRWTYHKYRQIMYGIPLQCRQRYRVRKVF